MCADEVDGKYILTLIRCTGLLSWSLHRHTLEWLFLRVVTNPSCLDDNDDAHAEVDSRGEGYIDVDLDVDMNADTAELDEFLVEEQVLDNIDLDGADYVTDNANVYVDTMDGDMRSHHPGLATSPQPHTNRASPDWASQAFQDDKDDSDVRGCGCGGCRVRMVCALVCKSVLLQWRHPWQQVCNLLTPVLVIGLVSLMQLLLNSPSV